MWLGTRRGLGVFEYRADFVPEVESKRARFALLATEAVAAAVGRTHVFDGGHRLLVPRPLREQALRVATALAPGGPPVVVHVRFVRQAPPTECAHLYNVLFKKLTHCLQLAQLGRNYFDRKGAVLVPQHKWVGLCVRLVAFTGVTSGRATSVTRIYPTPRGSQNSLYR